MTFGWSVCTATLGSSLIRSDARSCIEPFMPFGVLKTHTRFGKRCDSSTLFVLLEPIKPTDPFLTFCSKLCE